MKEAHSSVPQCWSRHLPRHWAASRAILRQDAARPKCSSATATKYPAGEASSGWARTSRPLRCRHRGDGGRRLTSSDRDGPCIDRCIDAAVRILVACP
jgi:hypothetical protein